MRKIVLAVMLLLATQSLAQQRGAFFAFDGKDSDWAATFAQMKSVGMNVAILQYTAVDAYFYDKETDAFIAAAETAEMPYYLGLHYHGFWDQLTDAEIKERIDKSISLLTTTLPPKVKSKQFFRGWYMPLEAGNDPGNMKKASKLTTIAKKTGDTIAMSVYFDPDDAPPDVFAATLRDAIAPYDFVLLQDSVAVAGATKEDLARYYTAIETARKRPVWIVVEAFHEPDIGCQQFADQVRDALGHTSNIVVFEWKELRENRHALNGWLAGTGQQPCP